MPWQHVPYCTVTVPKTLQHAQLSFEHYIHRWHVHFFSVYAC